MRPEWRQQFEGAFSVGKINDEQRFDVVRHACPGAGAWLVLYSPVSCMPLIIFVYLQWRDVHVRFSLLLVTNAVSQASESANTMSSALEVLGMSLPYSSSTPALYPGSFPVLINLSR